MAAEETGKPQRVTMKDVARQAGVSQSTVSFVLNGQEDMRISGETRRRVLEAVKALGYRPRGAGRPPRQLGLRVIGVMFDQIATSPFAAISVDGIQEEAWQSGVMTEVVMTGGDPDYEAAVLRKWQQDGVLGVIYGAILTREAQPPPGLAQHRAVLLNCHDPEARFPSVVPAERRGSEAAVRALIAAGHARIAYISGEPWMEASEQRLEGYERALRAAGRAVDPALVKEGNFLPSGGRSATLELMRGPLRPDAIYCANDLTALGCYEALKELGETIGETIAVMGYDDQEVAQHLSPQLSTVLLPHREMGQLCVKRLLAAELDGEQVRLECPLVPRESHVLRPGG
ncbi:LacI family DNA-binding transcriptional regulator [Roseivivax sp. GX 12232]|uniref:LacI family DNA-binding transcriptional regulator n=1 Tax=Roseivivax sp. GX 12232 TaxID=2900547 RepID=UPI001E4848E4|nr:LacI family DNA-binding transcriptional regulator [Roseivivax sp. GX 12232]MCE0506129.1 LacI family DNA-binding transcriptional regulator [Roseivivax sp. GX 12232]